jgi:hypothetical protein
MPGRATEFYAAGQLPVGNVIIKSVSFEELRGGAEGSLAPGTCVIMQL